MDLDRVDLELIGPVHVDRVVRVLEDHIHMDKDTDILVVLGYNKGHIVGNKPVGPLFVQTQEDAVHRYNCFSGYWN